MSCRRGTASDRSLTQFGVTIKQLQNANNLTDPDLIFPGQTLIIP